VVTRVARKRNVLVRRPVHLHRDQGVAAAVEVRASCSQSGAHLARASNHASDVQYVDDLALAENWAGCCCKRKSMNTQTTRSREMVMGVVEVGSVASSQHETGEAMLSPDVSARRAVHAACART
jgi:hypothetical protein